MEWAPFARARPVANHSGAMSDHLGLILHVQEGNNDLFAQFNRRSSQSSSTWSSYKDGGIDQWVSALLVAWAQARGNATYNSVETQGFATEALTAGQIAGVAKLYRWGHDTFGWPYRLAEHPGEPGLGYHGMGGKAWGGHTGCAGAIRDAQRPQILRLAQGGIPAAPIEEDDIMADPQAVEALLTSAVLDAYRTVYGDGFVPSDDAVKVQVDAAKTQGMVAVYGLMYRAKQRAK